MALQNYSALTLSLCAKYKGLNVTETISTPIDPTFNLSANHIAGKHVFAEEATKSPVTSKTYPDHVSYQWFEILIPIVCGFGIVGNLLNLAVLTRRRLRAGLDKLGLTANHGLVGLALSDLLFCVVVMPHAFFTAFKMNGGEVWLSFWMHYKIHGIATINLLMMVSTWLIVTMAVKRYFVVVDPLHAREMITTRRTCCIIALVYALSALFTLPHYLHITVSQCVSPEGAVELQHVSRYGNGATSGMQFYVRWIWPIIADFIPIAILIACNCRLVAELKTATVKRRSSCPGQALNDGGQKVTLILVIIVLMLLLLVAPSEIIRYIDPYRTWGRAGYIVATVTNLLQTVNFAFNFLLYFIVSAKFRKTVKNIVRFRCSPPSSGIERYPLGVNDVCKSDSYRKCSNTKTWLISEDLV